MPKKRQVFRFLVVFFAVLLALPVACTASPPTSPPQSSASPDTNTDHTNMAATEAPSGKVKPISGCEIQDYTLDSAGAGAPFAEPPDGPPVQNGTLTTTLTVQYGDNTIGNCSVHLRSYNGKLVGPTLRVRPGDTLRITLDNQLPVEDMGMPHVINTIGALNHTNLHTHGLHVSPAGNSDNVLLDIAPGEQFEYEIKIPEDHVPGTYWYHAHLHGSTATQLASGMEGALIIMGDQEPQSIDSLPSIKNATEKIFVFQQLIYDEFGYVEPDRGPLQTFPTYNEGRDPNDQISYFGPCNWEPMKREHLINGQLFPELTIAPNEVQRWRFIDAGIRESIGVELRGPYTGSGIPKIEDVLQLPMVKLNEIAVDGIALNKVNAWDQVELEPGYRSDVLVQIKNPGRYYLIDNGVLQTIVSRDTVTGEYTTKTETSDALTCPVPNEQPNFLATINVSGASKNMSLPSTAQMSNLPLPYKSIIDINPAKVVMSGANAEKVDPVSEDYLIALEPIDAFQKVDFTVALHPRGFTVPTPNKGPTATPPIAGTAAEFMAADHPFDPQNPRRLILGNTEEWILNTQDDSLYYAHPFHIHVNPFQTWRFGPDGNPETVWRDTILVRQGVPTYIFTRYQDYIGQYVYHCHILDHEDQGMMELVEIVDPPAPTATPQP